MPTSLREITITSLRELMDYIEPVLSSANGSLWYRGCAKKDYQLVPSLYRHKDAANPQAILDLEKDIIIRFKQRSIPYQYRDMKDDWEQLFFMQHYGVPTRLLDWTENPLIALYFALTGTVTFNPMPDAAVWVLKPVEWNNHVNSQFKNIGIFVPGDEGLNGYRPATDQSLNINRRNNDPVMMFGAHNSSRIVAQRGVFAIFGTNIASMEDTYKNNSYPQDVLVKLIIPSSSADTLLKNIITLGVTDSVVFPDLDGLAKETRRHFDF